MRHSDVGLPTLLEGAIGKCCGAPVRAPLDRAARYEEKRKKKWGKA